MSFENLAPTWTDRPLTDPAFTADVVDLMVSIGDRHRGTLTVLICDPDDRYRAAVAIELPPDAIPPGPGSVSRPSPAELCGTAMHPIVPALRTAPGTSLVLALGRPGPARLTDLDTQWAQAGAAICEAAAVRLLGFYIATHDDIHHVDVTTPAAAA
jgi:hypothetical protein